MSHKLLGKRDKDDSFYFCLLPRSNFAALNRRLIEILSRIYPIRTEGEKIETDFDMPELQEIISRFERDLKRCGELKQELLG
mgnify:CR=1 FL=1